jgi:hypothetical protein
VKENQFKKGCHRWIFYLFLFVAAWQAGLPAMGVKYEEFF